MLWALQAMTGDHVYRFKRRGGGVWSMMTISDWDPRDGSNLSFLESDEGVTSDQMFAMLCQLDKQRACLAASITSTQGEDRDTYKSVVSGRPINI